MTPLNVAFWGGLYAPAQAILREVAVNPLEMFLHVLMLLGVPLALGLWTARRFPGFTVRAVKPFKILSIDSDSSFVAGKAAAVKGEWEYKVFCRYNGKAPLGDFRAMLTLNTDDPKQPKIRIPVMGIVN